MEDLKDLITLGTGWIGKEKNRNNRTSDVSITINKSKYPRFTIIIRNNRAAEIGGKILYKVSEDGSKLMFMSTDSPNGFVVKPNTGKGQSNGISYSYISGGEDFQKHALYPFVGDYDLKKMDISEEVKKTFNIADIFYVTK